MIVLMMVVATSTASFAKVTDSQVKTAVKEVAQTVKDTPSGTTYGVVEATKSHIVVNTPLGRYTINKQLLLHGHDRQARLLQRGRIQGEDLARHVQRKHT